MTTSRSPLRAIRLQANLIAARVKAAERGRNIAPDPAGKLEAARTRESITFAVVMDDKILKIEMPWATIRECSESEIADYLVTQMQGGGDAAR